MALEADFATAKREAVVLVEQGLSPAHYGTYELLMTTLGELLNRGAENGLTSQLLGESDVTVCRGFLGLLDLICR
jgi:hypothetical protein